MSVFEFVSVAISIILGLGVTRLLTSLIELVRNRDRIELHWVPITWAIAILIIHFQFWWNLFWLSENHPVWTNQDFLMWVFTTLALVTAGNLILPTRYDADRTDLFDEFLRNGRIGLGSLAVYMVMGFVITVTITDSTIFSVSAAVSGVWLAPVVLTIFARGRRAVAVGTVVFTSLSLFVWALAVARSWA